jgi:hypothetical protein
VLGLVSGIPFFGDVLNSNIKGCNDSFLEFKDAFETDVVIDDFDKGREVENVGLDCDKNHYRQKVIHAAQLNFAL